jgi:hypothetical protein
MKHQSWATRRRRPTWLASLSTRDNCYGCSDGAHICAPGIHVASQHVGFLSQPRRVVRRSKKDPPPRVAPHERHWETLAPSPFLVLFSAPSSLAATGGRSRAKPVWCWQRRGRSFFPWGVGVARGGSPSKDASLVEASDGGGELGWRGGNIVGRWLCGAVVASVRRLLRYQGGGGGWCSGRQPRQLCALVRLVSPQRSWLVRRR